MSNNLSVINKQDSKENSCVSLDRVINDNISRYIMFEALNQTVNWQLEKHKLTCIKQMTYQMSAGAP
jgi:hypothetical protein